MVKVIAKNYAKEEKIDEILKLCTELIGDTRNEEGCVKYELYQDIKDSTILTFVEEWENKEALEKHMQSEHFIKIVPLLGNLMCKEADMNVYSKLI